MKVHFFNTRSYGRVGKHELICLIAKKIERTQKNDPNKTDRKKLPLSNGMSCNIQSQAKNQDNCRER